MQWRGYKADHNSKHTQSTNNTVEFETNGIQNESLTIDTAAQAIRQLWIELSQIGFILGLYGKYRHTDTHNITNDRIKSKAKESSHGDMRDRGLGLRAMEIINQAN